MGQCRVPADWRLLWHDGDAWHPVSDSSGFGTAADRFNDLRFAQVTPHRLRLEVDLQPSYSGGVLEMHVG